MRVLLDECLPRGLKKHLSAHDVRTVPEAGWAGKKNGELLRLASGSFDIFVTVDKNIAYQQNLLSLPFGVITLSASSNRLADLAPLIPALLEALDAARPGQIVKIGV